MKRIATDYLKVGDLVVLLDHNQRPDKYKYGLIVREIPSKDGSSRVFDIWEPTGNILQRNYHTLAKTPTIPLW